MSERPTLVVDYDDEHEAHQLCLRDENGGLLALGQLYARDADDAQAQFDKIAAALNAEPAGLTDEERSELEQIRNDHERDAVYANMVWWDDDSRFAASEEELQNAVDDVHYYAQVARVLDKLLARSAPASETEAKPVTLTEGPCNKGGQNPPPANDARPPAPGGSGGCRAWSREMSPEEAKAIHDGPTAKPESADDTVTVRREVLRELVRGVDECWAAEYGESYIAEAEATLGEEGNDAR